MTLLEQVILWSLVKWESEWTPFSRAERRDLVDHISREVRNVFHVKAHTGNDMDRRVGKIVRDRRVERGISQAELAKKMRVSRGMIASWEQGLNHITKDRLGELDGIIGPLDLEGRLETPIRPR